MYKLRFAPSPTGFMHLANARVAILNYVRALQLQKTSDVTFILRIDDTDVARSKQIYKDQIIADLKWFGITYNEIYKQSERTAIYNEIIEKLKEAGFLYAAYETEEELKQMRETLLQAGNTPRYQHNEKNDQADDINANTIDLSAAESHNIHNINTRTQKCWRFKIEKNTVSWHDEIMQNQSFTSQALYDPVVIRSDGTFTYILASVIDDYLMDITHIMRGRDHLTNTAIQIHMLNALNKIFNTEKKISFAHFPLLYSIDGQKLSKRADSMNIKTLQESGMLNITIIRFLLNLGLPKSLQYEFLSDIINVIDIHSYNRADILCDTNQLYTDNQKYVQMLNADDLHAWLESMNINMAQIEKLEKYWNDIKCEIGNKQDLEKWLEIMTAEKIYQITDDEEKILTHFISNHEDKIENWEDILQILKTEYMNNGYIKTLKEGITAFRHALTGDNHGPKMHVLFEIIDKKVIKMRLKK